MTSFSNIITDDALQRLVLLPIIIHGKVTFSGKEALNSLQDEALFLNVISAMSDITGENWVHPMYMNRSLLKIHPLPVSLVTRCGGF